MPSNPLPSQPAYTCRQLAEAEEEERQDRLEGRKEESRGRDQRTREWKGGRREADRKRSSSGGEQNRST